MLSVFETGDASFRLADRHDADVGWIRDGALGFDGFATEADAIAGAVAGSEALRAYLDRVTGAIQPGAAPRGRVRVVNDGAFEWVARGSVPLARLLRPAAADLASRRRQGFAVEFVLPSYVRAGSAIGAAQVVHHAIENGRGTTLATPTVAGPTAGAAPLSLATGAAAPAAAPTAVAR